MNFENEKNIPAGLLVGVSILFLIAFTLLDIFRVIPVISDGMKLAGIVLCFLFSIYLLVSIGVDMDRTALMVSFVFAILADSLLLFTNYYICGILSFCAVQEFHSIRIFAIKKSVVRIDGRIASSYRSYKIRNRLLLLNLVQFAAAGAAYGVGYLLSAPHRMLLVVSVFYIVGFSANLFNLARISGDVRLLDDMRPLKAYFWGMLMYFLCDILLGVFRIPDYFPVFTGLAKYTSTALLVVWPLYLAGMVLIVLSGIRRQSYYS